MIRWAFILVTNLLPLLGRPHRQSRRGTVGFARRDQAGVVGQCRRHSALDLANYVNSHSDSNLASLSRHGATFTNSSTASPADSFPGLAALVTGGSPDANGLWYDDIYNRALSRRFNRMVSAPRVQTVQGRSVQTLLWTK
jgi:Type I phosphodiesterase / nucleotide pyrophosphatase